MTVPSESEAVALRVNDAGAAKTEPLDGEVKATLGGILTDCTLMVPIIKG